MFKAANLNNIVRTCVCYIMPTYTLIEYYTTQFILIQQNFEKVCRTRFTYITVYRSNSQLHLYIELLTLESCTLSIVHKARFAKCSFN